MKHKWQAINFGPRRSLILALVILTLILLVVMIIDHHAAPLWILPVVGTAWASIAASETDVNSILNQSLMDKIRGNLYALAEEERILLQHVGRRYDNGTLAWLKVFPDASHTTGAQDTWYDIADDHVVNIPVGAESVHVWVRLAVPTIAGSQVRAAVGTVYSSVVNITATGATWYECIITGMSTGIQTVKIQIQRNNTGQRTFTLDGVIVTAILATP